MYGKQTETAIAALSRLAEVYDEGRTRLSAAEIASARQLQGPTVAKIMTVLAFAAAPMGAMASEPAIPEVATAGVAQSELPVIPLSSIPATAVVVGGFVIVGAIVIGVVASDDDSSSSTSTTSTN